MHWFQDSKRPIAQETASLWERTVLRMLTLLWQGAGADRGEQREHRTL